MIKKIKKNNLGYNCSCDYCGKTQTGSTRQPFIVYFKAENEKRGSNLVACSEECAKKIYDGIS